MSNTTTKLIATIEVKINKLNDYLSKPYETKLNIFRFIMHIAEILSLLKSWRIFPIK